jgi:ABC transporter with metal-binding/Fe-S-binding domain ATP-binding protein
MKLAVLFSGGKDSCLALHKAIQEGHKVLFLLSILPETQESFMFHTPYLKLLKKQAERLGIKLITVKTKAEKEKELEDLERLIRKVLGKVDGICVGGIASNYQGERIKNICQNLNLRFYAPLWGYSGDRLWEEIFSEGFKVIITRIACEGLSSEFIGKIIDKEMLEKIRELSEKYKFRVDFEGGEAETAVLFMPEFKDKGDENEKEIKIDFSVENEGKYNCILDLKKIKSAA